MKRQNMTDVDRGRSLLASPVLVVVALCFSMAATLGVLYCLLYRGEEVVFVDSVKILSEYKGTQKAKASYEQKVAVWKANLDTLAAEFNATVKKYQKDKAGMTAKERTLTEELLTSKQQQLNSYQTAIKENAAKEDQAATTRIYDDITDFLKEYGKKHHYAFILGTGGSGNVIYAKEGKDITDKVVAAMNEGYSSSKQ